MSYQSLLFCPDEKTARVVTQVLTELEFTVELCNEPFATVKKLMAKQYDAIVVDCDNEQNAALLFKSARNSTSNQTCLAVAVVEGQAGVAKAFRIGANLVLTKPVNVEQSKGTLRVARGLLRKAETGKAAGATMTSAVTPAAMSTVPSSFARPGNPTTPVRKSMSSASFAASTSGISKTPVAAASSETFEIQEDPTPKVEPTEAAFLESIPKPVTSRAQDPSQTTQTHKASPWLQLSRPVRDSKESASENNSENASTHPDLAPTAASVTSQVRVRHPFNTGGFSSGQGAAAAPAKEVTKSSAVHTSTQANQLAANSLVLPLAAETEVNGNFGLESSEGFHPSEAPAFSMGADETKRSKVPVIAALAVIAIAGAGYFGWNKMQTAAKPASVQNQLAVTAPSTTAPAAAQPELGASPTPATSVPAQQVPQLNPSQAPESQPTSLSSKGKPAPDEIVVIDRSASEHDVETKPLSVKKTHEPLAVKGAPADIEQTVVPPALQVGSIASDQTIARLITSSSVPLPKRAPEVLKMSQGITQGLLVKRVNPVYPNQALQMHKQGTVQILASITKSGSISSAKVIKGDPILGQAALEAVKQWKYKPYTLDGQAVEVQTYISVNFKLP
ncbi:MAG: TonB family protein [Terriglobales bacterium]|jgi:protein TonB|nr:TonB family protein [Terriglobales bacterium]